MAERTVYILLTRSGTCFSRLIHLATGDGYTHASIGLEGPDGPFYSFARKYRHFALPAGLMEEHPAAFEAFNWGVLALSAVTFALALGCYMAVRL